MENNVLENSISTKELLTEYNWYYDTFSSVIQDASDDFFTKNFKLDFVSLSKNINCILNNESCFVTKIKINDDYDMFFRLTEKTVDVILEKILGKNKTKFNINKISEIEAKIMTAFNSHIYNALRAVVNPPDIKELKRTNFDMINMTFILKDVDNHIKTAGKVIVTIPEALLKPVKIKAESEKFANTDFSTSKIPVNIVVGSTRFPLYEIKQLEADDVVVFEDSNLEQLALNVCGEKLIINLNPNMGLLMSQQDNNTGGDDGMAGAKNIWDSIEVDLIAEFDSVKISLGDLKQIEDGLVMDLASLYDNKISLKVEGTKIAEGNLVIVNDRYGVKITDVVAKGGEAAVAAVENNQASRNSEEDNSEEDYEENNSSETYNNNDEEEYESSEGGDEEENFDYTDFELEDEDNI